VVAALFLLWLATHFLPAADLRQCKRVLGSRDCVVVLSSPGEPWRARRQIPEDALRKLIEEMARRVPRVLPLHLPLLVDQTGDGPIGFMEARGNSEQCLVAILYDCFAPAGHGTDVHYQVPFPGLGEKLFELSE
jgi:hypothetical protein